MSPNAKLVVSLLVIVAIIIPVLLAYVLIFPLGLSPTRTVASSSSASSAGGPPSVIMPQGAGKGLNFSPVKLTVAAGTTITFIDQDSVAPHNVYFTSMPGGATIADNNSPPTMHQGDTYNVTLTVAGTYNYDCQFHSTWMQATIVVTG